MHTIAGFLESGDVFTLEAQDDVGNICKQNDRGESFPRDHRFHFYVTRQYVPEAYFDADHRQQRYKVR